MPAVDDDDERHRRESRRERRLEAKVVDKEARRCVRRARKRALNDGAWNEFVLRGAGQHRYTFRAEAAVDLTYVIARLHPHAVLVRAHTMVDPAVCRQAFQDGYDVELTTPLTADLVKRVLESGKDCHVMARTLTEVNDGGQQQ